MRHCARSTASRRRPTSTPRRSGRGCGPTARHTGSPCGRGRYWPSPARPWDGSATRSSSTRTSCATAPPRQHRDTLRSQSDLADSYLAAGRRSEAIALHRRTLARRERALGPDEPDTRRSRSCLEAALEQQRASSTGSD
ncbi:tetratricopeptide repeat protein [Streptomyces sp. REN17]|uniref:tetratricopeptide repeat protein n=1 Tax=Streptomyces beigongshangae TaxID=2841597 RepID=UPI001C841DA2